MSRTFQLVVADDEADMLRYYQRTLTGLGHVVLAQAASGHELVRHCLNTQPDLVISDIAMPELDGLSAMARIQREFDVPFILVTAFDDKEHLEELRQHNVLAHLVKPIKRAHLVSALAVAATIIALP
jgi:response regulator NasT